MSDERVIYKYETKDGETILEISKDAQFLSLGLQGQKICLWFLCDPKAELERRMFRMYLTGQIFTFSASDRYIGSFQALISGQFNFIGHVFETPAVDID